MHLALVVTICLAAAGIAIAETGTMLDLSNKHLGNHGGGDGREGGETIADAFPIPGIPFVDTGNTCDNIDDYDYECPYDALAPDVVYAYTSLQDNVITIDLCASLYDTKIIVYEHPGPPGHVYECNDDAGCGITGYQSRIEDMSVVAGQTYYIVIDGYGWDCGDFELSVVQGFVCEVECPPGAMPEGEPALVENYVDTYNSGCNSSPPTFQALDGDVNGRLDFCGHGGTYLYFGSNWRDTDWFTCVAIGTSISFEVTPEHPVHMFQLDVEPDCTDATVLESASPGECETGTLQLTTTPGELVYLWVGSQTFEGVSEFPYWMTLDGIEGGATPIERSSWGAIKSSYR